MKLDAGKKAAKRILSSYPDYGKAPAEYLLSMTELLASYPENIIARLADLRTGIASRTSYLPTVHDVTKLANEFLDADLQRRKAPRREAEPSPARSPYMPFPKLWEALASEKYLLEGRTFDCLFEASRRLAMQGKQEAIDYLTTQARPK